MRIHPEVVAQRMSYDIFDHSLRQRRVDHAAERLGERRVGHDPLDPGPEVQHRLAAGERREIGDRATRGEDDVIDGSRIWRSVGQRNVKPGGREGVLQRCAILGPEIGARGEEDGDGHGALPKLVVKP